VSIKYLIVILCVVIVYVLYRKELQEKTDENVRPIYSSYNYIYLYPVLGEEH